MAVDKEHLMSMFFQIVQEVWTATSKAPPAFPVSFWACQDSWSERNASAWEDQKCMFLSIKQSNNLFKNKTAYTLVPPTAVHGAGILIYIRMSDPYDIEHKSPVAIKYRLVGSHVSSCTKILIELQLPSDV